MIMFPQLQRFEDVVFMISGVSVEMKNGFYVLLLLTITSLLFIITSKKDRKGKSVERRGRKATGLMLKRYDSRAAEVTC